MKQIYSIYFLFCLILSNNLYSTENNTELASNASENSYNVTSSIYKNRVTNYELGFQYYPEKTYSLGAGIAFPFPNGEAYSSGDDASVEISFTYLDFITKSHALKSYLSLGYDDYVKKPFIGSRLSISKVFLKSWGYEFGIAQRLKLGSENLYDIFPYFSASMISF